MPNTAIDHRNWTTPGAQDAAQATYTSVKRALAESDELRDFDIEVFLQGSYANATNTRGDSDVDVVVMMKRSYLPDITRLPPDEAKLYEAERTPATKTVTQLRAAVHSALNTYYGSSRVKSKDKCLRVARKDGYVDADVVPSMQHRVFTTYPSWSSARWFEGIAISPLAGGRIVNFPKEHFKNGQTKNQRAGDFKATVRQVKRLRRSAVDAGLLAYGVAPGYLLECMTYNAPDALFVSDDSRRLINILSWMHAQSAYEMRTNFYAVDRIHHLFQNDPGKFDADLSKAIIDVLWNHL